MGTRVECLAKNYTTMSLYESTYGSVDVPNVFVSFALLRTAFEARQKPQLLHLRLTRNLNYCIWGWSEASTIAFDARQKPQLLYLTLVRSLNYCIWRSSEASTIAFDARQKPQLLHLTLVRSLNYANIKTCSKPLKPKWGASITHNAPVHSHSPRIWVQP